MKTKTEPANPPPDNPMLAAIAEEIFSMSTIAWQMRQRSRGAGRWDLSETEFLALDLLVRNGTMTVGLIQRQIGVLPAQMSRIIRSLEGNFEQPLIACSINSEDKRKVDVAPTDAGRRAHREFRDARLSQSIELLSHVPEGDVAEFVRIVRVMRQAMTAAPPPPDARPAAGR